MPIAELLIRGERAADVAAIRQVVTAVSAGVGQSNQSEHLLLDRLRKSAGQAISLVAEVAVALSVMSSSFRAVYLTDSNSMQNYFVACGFVSDWN